ncbi:MAG TPA: PAS domain S-box protein, partial [Polyangiaceae bacterium]|nr:PAS domain S-box protein [Polyangiaceae bacterium]
MTDARRSPKVPPEIEAAVVHALDVGGLALVVARAASVSWMNSAACKLLDQAEQELELQATGHANDGLSPSFDSRLSLAILEASRAQDADVGLDAFATETAVKCRDGSRLPIAIAATSVGGSSASALGLISDLRADTSAYDAVRRSEERFERLVESLAASVWILREHRVIYANRAAAKLLGVDRALLIGVDITELLHPDDVPGFIDHLGRVERGENVLPHEYRAVSRVGAVTIVEFSSVLLEYDGESAVLSFGRDVTERKREEQRLLQADRLSALGMLASGMAHAINNPLTYVLLNLDHLSRKLGSATHDPESLADTMARLAEAREGAERMAIIVKRMRAFARTDESSPRVLDLRTILESVVDLIGHEVHHRGRLTTRFESVPPVLANESKVEQICLGLLLFAAQMLPDDAEKRHEVRLSLQADERKFAVLEVECEGCHVTDSEIARLFDPLTSREDGKALGFGLSVCRALIEQLGGQIEAESLPGTGLRLRTVIPYVPTQRAV